MNASSETAIEQRLVDLETRLSFQEHHIGELSDALAAARDEEARNALLLHRALQELKQLRLSLSSNPLSADPASEPPPPHY
ncbi:MAG TPA: SlyX family protein [Lysobacter sp.]|jgi:SlyX protein|nr:SlyX family protein [Lysobacter sp.]